MNKLEKTLLAGVVTGLVLVGVSDDPYIDGLGAGIAFMATVDVLMYQSYRVYCSFTGKKNIFDYRK